MTAPSTFALHEVAPGIHAAIAPGTAGPAVSNATIVDLGDRTLVVDTFMTLQAADELAEAVRRSTGREAHLVVSSHWHSDHVGGNQVFDPAPIVGTRTMRELILEDAPASVDEYERRVEGMRRFAADLAASAVTPDETARAEGTMALVEAMTAQRDRVRIAVPNVLLEERMEIQGSDRRAEIVVNGPGHTDSDVLVYLPEDSVVIAGDLIWTGLHPKTSDGHPAAWAESARRIAALRPSRIVPGHGEVGDASAATTMAEYFDAIESLVGAVRSGDADPASVEPPPLGHAWNGVDRFRAGLVALAARS